jgi:flagellar hook assembly protein FlgD
MKAPDYGTKDLFYGIWKEKSDLDLADSLWEGYKRMYAEYLDSSEIVVENPITGSTLVSVSPNPTRGPVQVVFELNSDQTVIIEVFDAVGRRVRNLSRMSEFRGSRRRQWDLRDDEGRIVPQGVYHIRVTGESFEGIERVVVFGDL